MPALKSRRIPLTSVLIQLLPAALLAALFAAVGVLHVTSRVMVVDAGYKLSRLEVESRQLALEHDRLTLELATLKSPAKLEAIARDQLGMAAPPAAAVITVRSQAPARATRQARAPLPTRGEQLAQRSAVAERKP